MSAYECRAYWQSGNGGLYGRENGYMPAVVREGRIVRTAPVRLGSEAEALGVAEGMRRRVERNGEAWPTRPVSRPIFGDDDGLGGYAGFSSAFGLGSAPSRRGGRS